MKNVQLLCHNCIRINGEKIIYTDPFKLTDDYNDADIIFITHSHYDHFSPEDIEKVRNQDTTIVVTTDLENGAKEIGFAESKIVVVEPGNEYVVEGIKFDTIPAYNTNKQFHPKVNDWCGYNIEMNNKKYYIAGDTDITEEAKNVKCDIAFVPVGGTYTMTATEAVDLVNIIRPEMAVPVHYGSIVGSKEDAEIFKSLLDSDIECEILM